MTSLARHIVLGSTGPHRNLPHAFRVQQLRRLHETAEKPVFRWEVRIRLARAYAERSVFCWILNGKIEPLRTLSNLRVNSLERKSQFGMYSFLFLSSSTAQRRTAILPGSSVRHVHFVSHSSQPRGPLLMHQ